VPGETAARRKAGGDPVTEADLAVDRVLRELLPRDGEGWLSEETVDDDRRLSCRRVWVVDPVDGTKEFVAGIPEWAVSIGLVEDGQPVAGGILNPAEGVTVLGAAGHGLTWNGEPAGVTSRAGLDGAVVLASRSELKRGEWARFDGGPFTIRPTGSVAWKLALVAAGRADATWSLVPKHEWDVAAGVALVRAGGGVARALGASGMTWNRAEPLCPAMYASGAPLAPGIEALLL